MIALDDFQALQRQVEKLKRDKDKALGALEQLKKQLLEEFDCKSLDKAKKLLDQLKRDELAAYDKYVKLKKEFEQKWKEQLDLVNE